MGLDDSRRFSQMQKSAIPCYADAATVASLKKTFYYVFDPQPTRAAACRRSSCTPSTGRSHLAASASSRFR